MSRSLLAVLSSVFCISCGFDSPAAIAPVLEDAQKLTREELVAEANAMIDSISARLSERDLAAAVASENVALLDQRADKLRERSEKMDARTRAMLDPHLSWLAEVHTTTTLSIGVLRNESRDFEEDKAEVLLWTRTFKKEIDALERRIDRIAPTTVYLSQRINNDQRPPRGSRSRQLDWRTRARADSR